MSDNGHPPRTVEPMRVVGVLAGVLVLAAVSASAHAADGFPSAPIEPVAPITGQIDPIEPIAPIVSDEDAPEGQEAQPRAPRAPRAPQLPAAPTAPDISSVTARIEAIGAKVASVAQRVGGVGGLLGDGQAFDEAASDEAIDTLQEARDLLGSANAAPQVSIGPDGCPTQVPDGTLREGADQIGAARLCADSVAQAATPEAAQAIKWAFGQLGSPYACGGVGRMQAHKFDCSSLVARAYSEGAGLKTATSTYAPSTRDLLPWGGAKLAPWAAEVAPENIRPGDLLVYRTCTDEPCSYQHVTMALADGYMLHTNRCGDVAHVTRSWGTDEGSKFAVARRVDPERAR